MYWVDFVELVGVVFLWDFVVFVCWFGVVVDFKGKYVVWVGGVGVVMNLWV